MKLKIVRIVVGAACLLLLAASLEVWIRSYRLRDHVEYRREAGGRFRLLSGRGRLMMWVQRYDWGRRPDITRLGIKTTTETWDKARPMACEHPRLSFLGFGYDSGLQGTTIPHWEVTLPYWFIAAVLCIPALMCLLDITGLRDRKANSKE
jgi:hypothetical protein